MSRSLTGEPRAGVFLHVLESTVSKNGVRVLERSVVLARGTTDADGWVPALIKSVPDHIRREVVEVI